MTRWSKGALKAWVDDVFVDHLDVRASHEKALKKKPHKAVSIQRFRERVKNGEKLTVINGSVYDIGSLFHHRPHPGGDFVDGFVGIDASLFFYTTHMKSVGVWKRLRFHWVGYLEETDEDMLAPRADRELMALIDDLADATEDSNFTYPVAHVVAQIAACLGLTVAQMYLAILAFPPEGAYGELESNWLLLSVGIGVVAKLIAIWFVHDIGHQSVCRTKEQNETLLKYAGLVMLNGIPNATMEIHNRHHCFPNVLGLDSTWDVPVFVWHPNKGHDEGLPFGYRFWAPLLWHCILWLYATVEYLTSWSHCVETKEYLLLFFIIARKLATFGLPMMFGHSWMVGASYFFAVHAASFILGFLSTLNHLAEKKETIDEFKAETRKNERSYVFHQAGKTCNGPVLNTENGNPASGLLHVVASWAMGHLNYHVEHHMIPYMPRQHLPLVAQRIRRICQLDEASRGGRVEVYRAKNYVETIPNVMYTLSTTEVRPIEKVH